MACIEGVDIVSSGSWHKLRLLFQCADGWMDATFPGSVYEGLHDVRGLLLASEHVHEKAPEVGTSVFPGCPSQFTSCSQCSPTSSLTGCNRLYDDSVQ
eukprot:7465531-Pyramimonas_sp.AAC.1